MPYNFSYLGYEDDPEPPIIITPDSNCSTLTVVGPEDDDPEE